MANIIDELGWHPLDPEKDPVNYFKAVEFMKDEDKMALAIAQCKAIHSTLLAQSTAMETIIEVCSKYTNQAVGLNK
jgi:hypothetical protein